jgi:hypothetical protein
MQMVRIRFPDDESRAEGFYQLMCRVKVIGVPDQEFIISESSLEILDEEGLSYTILEHCSLDSVLKAHENLPLPT